MEKIGIVGFGYVGQRLKRFFEYGNHYEVKIYDPTDSRSDTKEDINQSKLAVICVPTPMSEKDKSCDISIVEDVISWIETPLILIKSTIPPGTTDKLKEKTGKKICFSPEYIGEGKYFVSEWKYPNPTNPISHTFQIIGGDKKDADEIVGVLCERLGPEKFYYIIDAVEAEIVKYMENAWGATKVSFCQEFYDLCQVFGVSYNKVREGFLLDSRVERMHTAVFPDRRKWSGKCWPKDISAIIKKAEEMGYSMNLLKQVVKSNQKY